LSDPIIKVSGLTKTFDDVTAVDGLNLQVDRGQLVGLLGGNGAGKTTTIGMILGLVLPDSGSITVLGNDMGRHRYRVLPRMNFSSPYVDLPRRLTVAQNLGVYARLYGLRDTKSRIQRFARELELEEFVDRPVGTLSAGQKTRVAIAKSLINDPDLLLLDEPTASLDPDTADWVRTYLGRYQSRTGAAILLASHNMAEVERMCSSVLMMREGKVVDQGPPADLITRYGRSNMEEVFLDVARGEGWDQVAAQESAQ
jgi:ABC-2 type transport system ATP-binding protein